MHLLSSPQFLYMLIESLATAGVDKSTTGSKIELGSRGIIVL